MASGWRFCSDLALVVVVGMAVAGVSRSSLRLAGLYLVQSSIFNRFSRRKERSFVTRTASAANA